MNTTRHTEGTEARTKQPFLNLPLLLTIGAMILLGITTVTLGFLLRPEPTQWPETMETMETTADQPGADAGPGPDGQGLPRPDGPARLP